MTAAGGMSLNTKQAIRGYGEMMEALGGLDGLFHYRIYGDGAKSFTGEPALTPEQEREAKKVWKSLSGVKKTVEGVWSELRKLERDVEKIDDFMGYS